MAKRKLPPAPKLWARMVGGRDWEIYLPNGETMRQIDDLDVAQATGLARTMSVYRLSYLSPVRDLTGDAQGIAEAFGEVGATSFEFNTIHLFESREGSRAVVFHHHH
jgi:hypothetical protein